MDYDDKTRLRDALAATGAPFRILHRGRPTNAPSPRPNDFGGFSFRGTNDAFVEVHAHGREWTEQERHALLDAARPFVRDVGWTNFGRTILV